MERFIGTTIILIRLGIKWVLWMDMLDKNDFGGESVLIGTATDADTKYFRLQECKRLVRKIDNILDKLNDRDRTLIEGFYIANLF